MKTNLENEWTDIDGLDYENDSANSLYTPGPGGLDGGDENEDTDQPEDSSWDNGNEPTSDGDETDIADDEDGELNENEGLGNDYADDPDADDLNDDSDATI